MDENENLRLGDFGLSRMNSEESLWMTTATHASGTMRWMAPELIDAYEVLTVTKASDIYALGMIAIVSLSLDSNIDLLTKLRRKSTQRKFLS